MAFTRPHRPASGRGFTLVELLVVIGIIALLISILLPSLNQARQSAQAVKCLSNNRSFAQAMFEFAVDRKGTMIDTDTRREFGFANQGGGYAPKILSELGYLNLQEDPQIIFCPSAGEPGLPINTRPNLLHGTSTAKWVRDFTIDGRGFNPADPASNPFFSEGSYGVNGWFVYTKDNGSLPQPLRPETSGDKLANDSISGTPRAGLKNALFFNRISRVKDATNTPMIGDAVWSEAFPFEGLPGAPTLKSPDEQNPWPYCKDETAPPKISGPESQINRYVIARHKNGINLAYVDGHAGTENNLNRLWQKPWHQSWDTTLVDPNIVAKW